MEEVYNRIYNTERFALVCKDLDLNKGVLYNNKLYDIRIIPAKSNWTWVYRDDKGFWGVELYNEWNRDTVYITSANYYNLGEQVDVS